ncbi:MAG: HAD-IIIC family phosphatase, partial [Planctomycetes bacterium]|nr:HAD-IIIC family phosphatase [Planctomycetota bacterium]
QPSWNQGPQSLARVLQRLNALLLDECSEGRLHLYDTAGFSLLKGVVCRDPVMDFRARQPVGHDYVMALALDLTRHFLPLIVPRLKLLAVDADNTLWGGILGEDGVEGLAIGRDHPGNTYFAIQRRLKSLGDSGILLALISKNNRPEVEEAFARIPDQPLGLGDFILTRVDFGEKWRHLKAIAEELGLGLESCAFLDDSPFEREEMRQMLPAITVLADSSDPVEMLRSLYHPRLDALGLTREDRGKQAYYESQARREGARKGARSTEEFLRSLSIIVELRRATTSDLPRLAQMLLKTNQFNLCTRRHGEAELRRWLEDESALMLTARVRDNFGDQGLVGLIIALDGEGGAGVRIDSFLLSCRVLGRGVEDALFGGLLQQLRERDPVLACEYIPTAKNSLVADLYGRYGLRAEPRPGGGTLYRAKVSTLKFQVPLHLSILDERT